ncbi:DUF3256 family protein [Porphyromonas somerae]|jgi:hypothetical protein|uniref:DUF3256 domain-containing protein n=1 Tax=Porphyromonas somerae TaxID=322095 RepID=A0A134B404_9PORP|nr:DUF3256 family protein [Porphyromonas somerae]KXB72785.1 hypothetical protein HMPREF3184_01645 [Porphyromonadaceae bacterium KA00676]KXB74652.1 hypothetical protein HMPREF3185_01645 [Porphyromonas somerae]
MKQLRVLLFTALLLVSSLALNAQTTKYAAIIKALGQTELLDEDRRTQLATLLAQDSALSLPLELDLGAKLLAVSEHSLRLQTSPVGTAELRLLPLASGQGMLTTLIETVSSPQVDARISFLSASGEALPSTTLLRLPSSEDFLRGLQLPMSTASDRLRELLYPLHYELSWAQDTSVPTLIVRPTLLLSEEDKQSDELKALIAQLPALTTTWGGQSFAPFVRATNP